MTTIILNIGFEKIEDDKTIDFEWTGSTDQKVVIEQAIAHFLVHNGETNGWQFVTWKGAEKSGTLFNPMLNLRKS